MIVGRCINHSRALYSLKVLKGVGKVIFADGRVSEPITSALAGAGTHIS